MVAAGIVLVFLCGLIWMVLIVQTSLAFPAPPPAAGIPGAVREAGGESIWLDSGGKRVEAWFLPASTPAAAPLIINAHGNGELIDFWATRVKPLRDAGFGVLLVEYPGYGRSEGTPSEQSITKTMLAAYDWAAKDPRVNAQRIIGHGRSMGGGAIGQLARHRALAALVFESSYSSLAAMVRAHGVPDFLVTNRFDTLSVLREYRGPVLIVHGTRDMVIPFAHAKVLAAAAPQARFEVLECGHNDCPPQWELVLGFLAENGVSSGITMGDMP